jgi:hypothetical protein
MESCDCGTENCGEAEEHDRHAWVWGAVAAGAVVGAVGIIWLMQYRKPDRSMDRLLRRCYDRLEDIETSLTTLLTPEPVES